MLLTGLHLVKVSTNLDFEIVQSIPMLIQTFMPPELQRVLKTFFLDNINSRVLAMTPDFHYIRQVVNCNALAGNIWIDQNYIVGGNSIQVRINLNATFAIKRATDVSRGTLIYDSGVSSRILFLFLPLQSWRRARVPR